jgi:two-component system KDP operon response regulator KdpE
VHGSPSPSVRREGDVAGDDGGGHILVVDDEPALLRVLTAGLEARGYSVRAAATAKEALDLAAVDEPDVTLLDLSLPDLDGIDVCRHLRRSTRHPIIVLTADGAEDRKVEALDAGADDYVTKPFSLPELLARVRVALRHRAYLSSALDNDAIHVGALTIDVDAHVALLGGQELDLTPKEFALLTLLARNAGKVLTHNTVLEQVWGPAQSRDTLRTHVQQLRRKLGDGPGHPRILTEPGIGYRLAGPDD